MPVTPFSTYGSRTDPSQTMVPILMRSVLHQHSRRPGTDIASVSAATVTLDGSGSKSPVSGVSVTYAWRQVSGPSVTLSDTAAVRPTFTAPTLNIGDSDTSLVFELIVTVTVSAPGDTPPTANAGPDQAVASAASVTLDGSGSADPDPGDSITYAWRQVSGPSVTLSDTTAVRPTFTAPTLSIGDSANSLVFELIVTDSFGTASTGDRVTVTVSAPGDTPPTANAGPDQAVASAASVTLDGSASADPDPGDSITYAWRQVSGPSVTLSDDTAVRPSFTAPTLNIGDSINSLVFELIVTDSFGTASTGDSVTVTVSAPGNTPPTANAGPDQDVASAASVTLDGSASADPDPGDSITYAWRQVSGPSVTLSDTTAVRPTFTAPPLPVGAANTSLVFSLTVNDGLITSAADTVVITVQAPSPTPATEFSEYREEVKEVVVDEAERALRGTLASNRRLVQGARDRFIADRRRAETCDESQSPDTQPEECKIGYASRNVVPFDVDGTMSYDDGVFSTKGSFFEQAGNYEGTYRRLLTGDFDLFRDADGSTTANFNARLAWEFLVSDKVMFGAFLGGELARSQIDGAFLGQINRWGASAGAYGVVELAPELFADGYASLGVAQNSLEMGNGVLDLESDYTTYTGTVGGSVTGVFNAGRIEFWPQLSFDYGYTRIGEVGFTGYAYGLVDEGLSLEAGAVSLATLTFRPEVRFGIDDFDLAKANTVFSFSPRLLCQQITTTVTTRDCGAGGEVGLSSTSDDGKTTLDLRLTADRISDMTGTGIGVTFEHRF